MYKGKFENNQSRKGKQTAPNRKRVPASDNQSRKTSQASSKHRTSSQPSLKELGMVAILAEGNPQPEAAPQPTPSTPKKTTKGTVIFYSCLLAFVLVFAIAFLFAWNALNDWLIRFEACQPTVKCQQVFQELFQDPNWQEIYELAGGGDVSAQDYVEYMQQNYGGTTLTYIETSAGLSGDKKYIVRCDTEKIATFTLHNEQPEADIPDWQLGTVEIFYQKNLDITVLAQPGYQVLINGKELDESHLVRSTTTRAEEYLPEGVHGYRMNEFYVNHLLTEPVVEVLDENGNTVDLAYDEELRFYYEVLEPQLSNAEEDDVLTEAAQIYCKYMIGAATRSQLRKVFDSDSETYKTIVSNETWMQNYKGYELGEAQISEYYRYSDNLYSAQVELTLEVTRRDDTVKEYELCSTFFITEENGNSLVTQMTNANAQDVFTNVRLTYLVDDQLLHTEMVDEGSSSVTLPQVTVPQGKTFLGWFTKKTDLQGTTTLELVFEPSEEHTVRLSLDQVLEPMTLYAVFE